MILILGNASDNLLYLKTMLRQGKEEKECRGAFSSYSGKLYGQDVMLVETGYSSYRSEALTSYLLARYQPYFVIYLGDAMKISPNMQIGDIILPDAVQIVDVNELARDTSYHLNEVPGFPSVMTVVPTVRELFLNAAADVQILNIIRALVISTNSIPQSMNDLPSFDYNSFKAANTEEVAYESEIGGVALSAALQGVSFMPVLAVSTDINVPSSILERKKTVLRTSIDIGKMVIAFIAAISSNENRFIRGDEFKADKRLKF